MIKITNRRYGVVILAGVLVFVGWATAQPGPGCHQEQKTAPANLQLPPAEPEPMSMRRMGMMHLPELTDKQREQIRELRIRHLREIMPMETEIQIKEMELDALWQVEKFDAQGIVAKVKEIGELRTKLELARVNHQIEIYKMLTPEQRKSFRPWWGKMMMRGMMGRKWRQMHGGGNMMELGTMPCCPQR